jgi:hypothetical protein
VAIKKKSSRDTWLRKGETMMASQPIYQFYAELEDFRPKIWRRFQVPGNITIARLGYILMALFEMEASHLFALEWRFGSGKNIKTLHYEVPMEDEERSDSGEDATAEKLSSITREPKKNICRFQYDFGDDWWVMLNLEKVYNDPDLPGKELPRVLEGEGFGIIEDCGGVGGLAELAKAFKQKKGASYDQFCEWLGVEDFDVSAFDMDDMNFRIKKLPRIYKQIYEDGLEPTQQSIDLIERKYRK